jgi:hypothetical protein
VVFDRLRSFAAEHFGGLAAPLDGGRIESRSDEHLRISVPTLFSARRLEHKRGDLEAACERFFGRALRVEIEAQDGGDAAGDGADPETLRERRQQALEHPAVNLALELLDGQIVEIRPLRGGP